MSLAAFFLDDDSVLLNGLVSVSRDSYMVCPPEWAAPAHPVAQSNRRLQKRLGPKERISFHGPAARLIWICLAASPKGKYLAKYIKRLKKPAKPVKCWTKANLSHIMSHDKSRGESMPQITLRGLDPDIERMIRATARKSKKSLNQVIQEMLRLKTDPAKKKPTPRGQSLKNLAGGWSDQEVAEFFESIKSCEQIDEEMWK